MSKVVREKIVQQGFFGRMKSAIVGIFVGLLMLLISVPLMFWNEWTAVSVYQDLQAGASSVVSVSAEAVDQSNEGALVHVVGPVTVSGVLSDPVFGVSVDEALRLKRNVEMYQWRENSRTETRGDERITTYSYERVWSPSVIDSSRFQQSAEHRNPTSMPYETLTLNQPSAKLGAFTLDGEWVAKFRNFQSLSVNSASLEALPADVAASLQVHAGGFYRGVNPEAANPASPQIGDIRITFEQAPATASTIVARQAGQGFRPFERNLNVPRVGNVPAQEIFDDAIAMNTMLTWVVRGVAFLMIFGGIRGLFGPIRVMAGVVPVLGAVVRGGLTIISFLLGAIGWLLILALSWIAARPLLGIGLLVLVAMFTVALIAVIGLGFTAYRKHAASQQEEDEAVPA